MFIGAVVTLMPRANPDQQAILRTYLDNVVPGNVQFQLLAKLFRTKNVRLQGAWADDRSR
eukprot:2374149-Pyramimonas_sp.AAC.1